MAKEIKKTITEFETSDGKVFASKREATEHETNLAEKAKEQEVNAEVRENVSKLLIQAEKLNEGYTTLGNLIEALTEFLDETDPNNSSSYESSDDYYDSGCSW